MLLRSICLIGVLSVAAVAAETATTTTTATATATLKGVIIDKDFAPQAQVRVLSTGIAGGIVVAEAHDRTALLKPSAVKSGYGVYTRDDKFYEFDAAGNAKALAAIRLSKKLDDFEAEVTGEVRGDTIKVTSIKLATN